MFAIYLIYIRHVSKHEKNDFDCFTQRVCTMESAGIIFLLIKYKIHKITVKCDSIIVITKKF